MPTECKFCHSLDDVWFGKLFCYEPNDGHQQWFVRSDIRCFRCKYSLYVLPAKATLEVINHLTGANSCAHP